MTSTLPYASAIDTATHSRRTDRDLVWTIVLGLIAAAIFPISRDLAGWQDADGILTSLISTQKLTWYFWGQDRILNLIPALASPLRNPEANLHAQLFLRAFMSAVAPVGVLVLFKRPVRHLLLTATAAQLLLALTLSGAALFNIYAQHNPFSSSLVMFGLSTGLLLHKKRTPWVLLALLAGFAAYATNIALIIFTLPFLGICVLTSVRPREELLRIMAWQAVMVALAYIHARRYGEHVTSFSANISWNAVTSGWASIATHVNLWALAALLVVASAATARVRTREALTAWLVAIGMPMAISAMSNLTWLQLNGFDIRYYLIFIVVFATCCAYLIVAALPRLPGMTRYAAVAGAALLTGVFFTGLGGLSPSPGELIAPRWREHSISAAHVATREQASLIVGDFWDVWPAVFEARELLRETGRSSTPMYGGAFRGHVLRRNIMKLIRERGEITSVCFQSDVDDCIRTTDFFITGTQPVQLVPGSLKHVNESGTALLVYQITSRTP